MRKGDEVSIPCSYANGAFSDEYLVTVDTTLGPVTGFTETQNVIPSPDRKGYGFIKGIVREMKGDSVSVILPGSFLNTTGIAYISRASLGAVP